MQSSTFCALLSGDKHIISILPAPNEALERTAHLAGFFRLFLVPSRAGRRSARALCPADDCGTLREGRSSAEEETAYVRQ
jgi:hypothetical protein